MKYLMRSELKDTYKILQLQNCILSIAKYLNDFCKTHSVEYALMGGSALGAIRHKGFIPWDDDLDVFMRPDDYEHFRRRGNSPWIAPALLTKYLSTTEHEERQITDSMHLCPQPLYL